MHGMKLEIGDVSFFVGMKDKFVLEMEDTIQILA